MAEKCGFPAPQDEENFAGYCHIWNKTGSIIDYNPLRGNLRLRPVRTTAPQRCRVFQPDHPAPETLTRCTMDVSAFLRQLTRQPSYQGQIVHLEQLPRRSAQYGQLRDSLHPALQAALRKEGIDRLFSHQAAAVNTALAGRHVVVVTGTASGKTLCYNLPVLEAILERPHGARPVSLPHQGAGAGSVALAGRAGLCNRRPARPGRLPVAGHRRHL